MADQIDEARVLSVTDRRKMAMRMKRMRPKLKRAREMAKKRMADAAHIEQRALRKARNKVRQRVAGIKKTYAELSPAEKMRVDKMMQGKEMRVKRIASRMVPKIRKAEQERLRNRIKNAISGNGSGSLSEEEQNEILEEAFLEVVADIATNTHEGRLAFAEAVDAPITTVDKAFASLVDDYLGESEEQLFRRLTDAFNHDDSFRIVMTEDEDLVRFNRIDNVITEGDDKGEKNHHLHVVYSKGPWGKREYQYRRYNVDGRDVTGNDKGLAAYHGTVNHHKRTNAHHKSLIKQGWTVEHRDIKHKKDLNSAKKEIHKNIQSKMDLDASMRRRAKERETGGKNGK